MQAKEEDWLTLLPKPLRRAQQGYLFELLQADVEPMELGDIQLHVFAQKHRFDGAWLCRETYDEETGLFRNCCTASHCNLAKSLVTWVGSTRGKRPNPFQRFPRTSVASPAACFELLEAIRNDVGDLDQARKMLH